MLDDIFHAALGIFLPGLHVQDALIKSVGAAFFGISKVVRCDGGFGLAMRSLERGQFASARSMLARARIIIPDHPSIEPTDAQIRLLSQAQRKKLTLNQRELRNEDPHMQRELKNMAQIPADSSCRFTISAGSDAQGRWIYQRLSEAAPQGRIRAQIQVRLPAAVERLCFTQ